MLHCVHQLVADFDCLMRDVGCKRALLEFGQLCLEMVLKQRLWAVDPLTHIQKALYTTMYQCVIFCTSQFVCEHEHVSMYVCVCMYCDSYYLFIT